MKIQIRQSTFETNSSSTHALVRVPMSDYKKFFEKGEGYLSIDEKKILTKEEVEKAHQKWIEEKVAHYGDKIPGWLKDDMDDIDYWAEDWGYYSYKYFNEYFEEISLPSDDQLTMYVSIYGSTD